MQSCHPVRALSRGAVALAVALTASVCALEEPGRVFAFAQTAAPAAPAGTQTPAPVAPQRPAAAAAQKPAPEPPLPSTLPPSRADVLRGEYGRYRANNDLLYYDLDVRVEPDRKFISGRNTIRFKMLAADTRIQLDLYANLEVDRIVMNGAPLQYTRELNTVWVEFPARLDQGQTYELQFHYSGFPRELGRFGGIAFRKDPAGRPWVNTACEGEGASIWWPSKDQWRDEPEGMDLHVTIPSNLVDVSNGRFQGKTDVGNGYTRWDWRVHYPINSYNVSLNIGHYVHFEDRIGDLTMDYWVLPESLDKAKRQFAQAGPMMQAFERYVGPYPFPRDGYKLIEVPYAGMEHQSAVTYGNRFANGYLERDWTGVGISPKFDFIIVHESGHEWFGNAVSAADVSDMWIQEGWTTYLESVYVEALFGKADAFRYVNAYKSKVQNRDPIVTNRGLHRSPTQDMYFKAALLLHTLRGVVDDDERWWRLVRTYYERFKYRNIVTEDVVSFFNGELAQDLSPVFDQYLRRANLPTLELVAQAAEGTLAYRWVAEERGFAMPVKIGVPGRWRVIRPTTAWQVMPAPESIDKIAADLESAYINVVKR